MGLGGFWFFHRVKHISETSDSWYQSFYTKKKKGKNKSWNAKNIEVIDKDKQNGN